MGKEGLTAKQVQFMKPAAKRIEVPAGPPKGLYLVIHPSGRKGWAFRYRWRGRPCNLTFAKPYPEMTLAAARAEAEAKREELKNDRDPAATQAEEIAQTEPNVVKAVLEEWLTRYVRTNTAEKTAEEFERILNRDIFPAWRDKYITEISKPDILRLLDAIVDRGAPITANRTFEVIRLSLNWCIERGYLISSPAIGIKPPSKEQSRDRVLKPEELGEVLETIEALGYPIRDFTRFLILTAQRRGEVATMRWRDIDLERAVWTLPAEATKPGRIHDVPLSKQALELLGTLSRFTKGDYVWTTTRGEKPINGFSKAKSRIDEETLKRRKEAAPKKERAKVKNIEDWTMHDLRRTAATHMAKAGVPPHILAAILNHTPGSTQGVTSIYNRFRYEKERREALQAWADYVSSLEPVSVKKAAG